MLDLYLKDLEINNIDLLKNVLGSKKVVLGFDGFIDTIVRAIQFGHSGINPVYFQTLKDFGNFILSRQGLSGSVELEIVTEKIGGNVPNTAAAMKSLGASVMCIGTLGSTNSHPLFKQTFEDHEMIPIIDPGKCISFEFNDGKLMCALNQSVNHLNWEAVRSKVYTERLIDIYSGCDMLAFLNWGEMPHATDIWQGFYDEIYPKVSKNKLILFDISDCSRKSDKQIMAALNIIKSFSKQSNVILSLNENEAKAISRALLGKEEAGANEGKKIQEYLGTAIVVFHYLDRTISFTTDQSYRFKNYVISEPSISTGGGDNFNAGFCCAILSGLSLPQATMIGSLCGSYYVKNAENATFANVWEYANNLLP